MPPGESDTDLLTILLIAFGLAMDAFAVSITCGLTMQELRVRHALRIALFFGVFQALMPIAGFLAGLSIRETLAAFDHWIAFVLLSLIGFKMIYEARHMDADEREMNPDDILLILTLALATSIDALAVGVSLSCLNISIYYPALIIGAVTFTLSLVGVFIGERVGHLFERKIEILGGLILIGIGLKILWEHLLGT